MSDTIVAADLPLPKPVRPRSYACAEYKLTKLRECPLDSGSAVDRPDKVYNFWSQHVPAAPWYRDEQETFVVLFLSVRKHITGFNLVSIGLLDSILVHAREVFRPAIVASAHTIVLAHNHPSGDPSPSEGDIKVTRDLTRGGQLLKIEVLDHVIVGRPSQTRPIPYVSLRELGFFFI